MAEELEPKNLYGIVVLGAMNPRLHHPLWYQTAKLLTEVEASAALKRELVCSTQISQFHAGSFRITCTEDRWEIVTPHTNDRERMVAMAGGVFDEKLTETPIFRFAFNNDFRPYTNAESVARVIADRVVHDGLRFSIANARASTLISFGEREETTNIRIEQFGEVANRLFVAVNSNHGAGAPEPPKNEFRYFKLGSLLEQHFQPDYANATQWLNEVVQSLGIQLED